MEAYSPIVIMKGVIHDPEFQIDFVFRSMLSISIGQAYLYLPEGKKTPEIVQMEMAILNNGDRNAPVYHDSIGKFYPIYWQDDLPEIPVACLNIFKSILEKGLRIMTVEDEFRQNYEMLFELYAKYYKQGDETIKK